MADMVGIFPHCRMVVFLNDKVKRIKDKSKYSSTDKNNFPGRYMLISSNKVYYKLELPQTGHFKESYDNLYGEISSIITLGEIRKLQHFSMKNQSYLGLDILLH